MTNTDLLRRTGEALYGPTWQSDLARALGVADRTVRRWVAAPDSAPSGIYMDLLRLLIERAAEIDDLLEPLKQAAAPK